MKGGRFDALYHLYLAGWVIEDKIVDYALKHLIIYEDTPSGVFGLGAAMNADARAVFDVR